MDRHLGSWSVPAAMLSILDTISVLIWVPLYDLVVAPFFERIGHPISRLMRMGVGFGIAIIAMVCAASVEIVRLQVVDRHNLQDVDPGNNSVPMSVWWQIPPLCAAQHPPHLRNVPRARARVCPQLAGARQVERRRHDRAPAPASPSKLHNNAAATLSPGRHGFARLLGLSV